MQGVAKNQIQPLNFKRSSGNGDGRGSRHFVGLWFEASDFRIQEHVLSGWREHPGAAETNAAQSGDTTPCGMAGVILHAIQTLNYKHYCRYKRGSGDGRGSRHDRPIGLIV